MKSRLLFLLCSAAALLVVCGYNVGQDRPVSTADFPELEPIILDLATDLHVLAPELTDHGAYFQQVVANADGKMTAYSEELLEAFVHQVIREAPEALILSGDLTFNGEAASHRHLAAALGRIEEAGIPVFVLPGNHDLDNPMAAEFAGEGWRPVESVTAGEFAEIYRDFGYGEALARDDASLSYAVELAPHLRLLLVDANAAEAPGAVSAETLAWVERQLQDAAEHSTWVVTVSHQNLLAHNRLFTEGYVMRNAAKLLALYERYPVISNLSGHIHLQHTAESAGGLKEIVTSSLAVSPHQYGMLRLEGTAADYRTVPVNVADWAREQGCQNSALLDFPETSRQFFRDSGYRQAMEVVRGAPNAADLAGFFAEVNAAYFAGRMDAAPWDDALFDDWQEWDGFLSQYLASIQDSGFENQTMCNFPFGGRIYESQ